MGTGQALYFWGGTILSGLLKFCSQVEEDSVNNSGNITIFYYCYMLLWICGLFTFQIYALVAMANGSLIDGNGMPVRLQYY